MCEIAVEIKFNFIQLKIIIIIIKSQNLESIFSDVIIKCAIVRTIYNSER